MRGGNGIHNFLVLSLYSTYCAWTTFGFDKHLQSLESLLYLDGVEEDAICARE